MTTDPMPATLGTEFPIRCGWGGCTQPAMLGLIMARLNGHDQHTVLTCSEHNRPIATRADNPSTCSICGVENYMYVVGKRPLTEGDLP